MLKQSLISATFLIGLLFGALHIMQPPPDPATSKLDMLRQHGLSAEAAARLLSAAEQAEDALGADADTVAAITANTYASQLAGMTGQQVQDLVDIQARRLREATQSLASDQAALAVLVAEDRLERITRLKNQLKTKA